MGTNNINIRISLIRIFLGIFSIILAFEREFLFAVLLLIMIVCYELLDILTDIKKLLEGTY